MTQMAAGDTSVELTPASTDFATASPLDLADCPLTLINIGLWRGTGLMAPFVVPDGIKGTSR